MFTEKVNSNVEIPKHLNSQGPWDKRHSGGLRGVHDTRCNY